MKAFLRALLGKLSFPFRRRRLDREMTEEIRLHKEVLVEQFRDSGLTIEEARRAAALKFGSTDRVQEECHDERSAMWLERWGKDVRFAARSLCRTPAFSASVILSLVLGIGVTALIFTDTDRALFRSPPYPDPERVVWITAEDNQGQFLRWRTGIHLRAYQEQLDHVFSEFAAATWDLSNVVIHDEPAAIVVRRVSEDFFHFLGIAPALGRVFRADEYVAGNDSLIVISDRFWRQRFNRDPDILGQQIIINQRSCTVAGVLAANERMPTVFAGDIYQPLVLAPDPTHPFEPNLHIFGRLRSGVPAQAARDAMAKVQLDPGMPDWAVAYSASRNLC